MLCRPPPGQADVAAHLADLARLYDSAKPETRQRIAQALFARVEVLGPTKVWLYPSEEAAAQGWATAMSGEFTANTSEWSGERSRAYTFQISVTVLEGNGRSIVSRSSEVA